MFTRILTPLLLGVSLPWAASYHFAANGDDTRTAAQAGSAATPWKSLSKVATLTLKANDSILLRKGDMWREGMVIKQSGAKFQPIVVTSYGDGTVLPELRGTVSLQGTSDGTYWSAVVPGTQTVKSVFRDLDPIPVSRFPDTGWITSTAVNGTAGVSGAELAAKAWTGASIHLRTAMWTLETHKIASQSGAAVTFDKPAIYTPSANGRFFVSNHASAMGTTRPAWNYNSTSRTLQWNGAGSVVEATVLPILLDINWVNYIRVQGIRFFGAASHGIRGNGNGIEVYNCEFQYPGLYGIYLGGGRESEISENFIRGANTAGIIVYGQMHAPQRNVVTRTAVMPFISQDGMGDGCCGGYGIQVQGDSSRIARNVIDSSGYNGVGFFGLASMVEENDIAHSCMTTDDCAGIYTITGYYDKAGATGSVVRRNFVRDAVGSVSGWPNGHAASQGIYLDDGSHDMRVDSNVVFNATNGIFLHNNQRVKVRDNVLFNNHAAGILMSHDALAGPGDMVDNQINGNLIVGLRSQGSFTGTSITQAQTAPFASYSGNTTCMDQSIFIQCRKDSKVIWQQFKYDTLNPGFGPETQKGGTFDTTVWGWSGVPYQLVLTLENKANCAKGTCLKVNTASATDNNSMVYGFTMPVTQGQLYRLSFLARGAKPNQRLTPTLRHARNSWEAMGYTAAVPLDTAWSRYEILMRADVTEDVARIDFEATNSDSAYWLDEVSFRTVPESMLNGLTPARILTNAYPFPGTGTLPNTPWMDPWGTNLPNSVSMLAYQGIVAFPFQGWTTSIPANATAMPLRILRNGSSWEFRGLTGPSTVIDVRGRTLAQLQPDASGNARWQATGATAMTWLRTGNQTRALIAP